MNNLNLIFDFDGTLIDSFHAVIEKFNLLADKFNFHYITEDEIDNLKNLTSKELIKYLKIPIYKIPRVILKARELMRKEMKTLPPFENLRDILKNLYDLNINLGILTSNSSENVTAWLQQNNLQDFFSFIYAESSYFGKHRILRKILKFYKMDTSQTFYIGDETRDIRYRSGKKMQGKIYCCYLGI
jgi:phosphoglycolate phosphatase